MAVAIQRAHWSKGFFNSKGGMEFPLTLGTIAAVAGIADPGVYSLDRALGIPSLGAGGYLAVVLLAWLAYVVSSRPPRTDPAKVSTAA
jgi:hypothetical protein